VNCATAAAGPRVKRPLRETGLDLGLSFKRLESAKKRAKSHG
jgi:hypothetical protein